jgi:hypothetical protein
MTRTKTFVIMLLALLISTAGLVSAFGQTQNKPKTQTTELKKGDCTDCKGTCADCKGNCTDCKGSCKDCKGHEKSCKGQCTDGHDKKAGAATKKPDKK